VGKEGMISGLLPKWKGDEKGGDGGPACGRGRARWKSQTSLEGKFWLFHPKLLKVVLEFLVFPKLCR
jgi:hypothetical protein